LLLLLDLERILNLLDAVSQSLLLLVDELGMI
jgi:hypothetical protein